MTLSIYIVNAFTDKPFGGNPAAVCPLDVWLDDATMQSIAEQNNLSETAFFVPSTKVGVDYDIRWFTPTTEVDLCGHATLASSFVLFRFYDVSGDQLVFSCKVGNLSVHKKHQDKMMMDFPSIAVQALNTDSHLGLCLGVDAQAVYETQSGNPDVLYVVDDEDEVRHLKPDFNALTELDYRLIIITAKAGGDADFVSRVFAPTVGVLEDPATGYAHTILTPYWSERLGKQGQQLVAQQLSKRGATLWCQTTSKQSNTKPVNQDRTLISGYARLFSVGEIHFEGV